MVTFDAQNLLAQEDLIEFAALDRSMLSGWIVGLERARLDLGATDSAVERGGG